MGIVYFSETQDRKDFASKILEVFKEPLEKARKVFVKPNIVSSEPHPTTTHPDVLDAVLNRLSGHDVMVGDGPAVNAGRSGKILERTQLREICDHHGVSLVNLYSEKMRNLESIRGYKLTMSALPLMSDLVISLPVLKVHNMLGLSGALKNQFGYLSRRDRILMHCKIRNIAKGNAEVNAAVPKSLFIVDAVETMVKAQECRHGGCPAPLGVMLGGADPVSLDCYSLQLLEKIEPESGERERKCMQYINYASDYSVGSKDFELLQI
jgi:uncharacterized protein (DUF362 family)